MRPSPTDDPPRAPDDSGTHIVADVWGTDLDKFTPGMTLKGPGQTQLPPDGAQRPLTSAPLPDVTLDGYELLRVLGEGGVGVVYQAIQKSIDRTIAVKMIKPDIGPGDRERAKFLTEAVVTGKLDHPNIVPIHDLGTTTDGQPFYTMKMVRGTPWSEKIRALSLAENLHILIAVCDAVSFAHACGVIHRDLKPENVMLGEFGEVQVMDWGLGALLSTDGRVADISKTQAAGGTPAYMAPEMVTGEDGPVGVHSDVYLLGAILYEIVTGKPPHGGQRVLDCLQNALFNIIEPTDRQDVLVDIARRAMQTLPTDRYPTVAAFNEALRDYQTHAESINLAEQSRGHLSQAIARRDYDLFAQALFGFRAALTRWADNADAQAGLRQTQLEYARCAFEKGDLDLAGTMLDPDWPAHLELAADIRRAIQRRDQARRRLRIFRTTAIALTAAVIVILTVAAIWIAAAKRQAVRAKEAAVAAQLAEAEQRRLADLERARAQEEEARAVQAFADLEKAVAAMIAAQTQEERAVARAQAADLVAVQTRDELARSGMLLDNSWWAFDAAEAQRRQAEAAAALALPAQITIMLAGTTPLDLVLIPPGDFVMGSPPKEERRSADEHLHRVQHTAAFYLARCELTQAQWHALGGTATTGPNNADLPATGLTYDENDATSARVTALRPHRLRVPPAD